MLTAVLALVALVLARKGAAAAVPVAWVVVVVGLLDFVNVARIVAETNLISYDIGAMWLALIWYVPLVLISLLAMLGLLLGRTPASAAI